MKYRTRFGDGKAKAAAFLQDTTRADVAQLAEPFRSIVTVLSGLFHVEPALVAGVLFLFVFNAIASLWLAVVEPASTVAGVITTTATRFGVYLLTLLAAVVLSNMSALLAWLGSFMFATLAAWEFLVMLGILARIYPPFRPIYERVNAAIAARANIPVPDTNDEAST